MRRIAPNWLAARKLSRRGTCLLGVIVLSAGACAQRTPKAVATPGSISSSRARLKPTGEHKIEATILQTSEGAAIIISDSQVCRRERLGGDGEVQCGVRPAEGRDVVLTCPSLPAVVLGTTDHDGRVEITWDELEPVFVQAVPPRSGSIDVEGSGATGEMDLEAARLFWARRALDEAVQLAADGRVDEATAKVSRAEALGGDGTEVKAAIEAAEARLARAKQKENEKADAERGVARDEHLRRAREFIVHDDPERAEAELDAAQFLGAETAELRHAAASTPAARKREADARRREAEEKRQEQKAQAAAAREVALANARVAKVRVPPLVRAVLDGQIDPLQKALVASAAMKARFPGITRPDAEDVLAVLQWGEGGLSELARARGLTARAVMTFAAAVFGPGLYCRMSGGMAGDTPIGKALARLRAAGSYAYMAGWTKKQVDAEIETLAAAYSASLGEYSHESYTLSLGMLKVVVPPLIRAASS
jgi:hypothetical protein